MAISHEARKKLESILCMYYDDDLRTESAINDIIAVFDGETNSGQKAEMNATDKEKLEILRKCFDETIWMAIRYAHGRYTYAPGTVRDAITDFQKVFPDWKPKTDITLSPPEKHDEHSDSSLYDLVGGMPS